MEIFTKHYLLLILLLIYCSKMSFAPPTSQTGETHCVFIHGLNPYSVPTEKDKPVHFFTSENLNRLTAPVVTYWGEEVKKWTQESNQPCTTYAFTYLDTMSKGYTDKGNSTAACEALNYENNTPQRIKVFLHSMGNLIFYYALANNYCTIDKSTTKVYSLAGPFDGAPIIEPLNVICAEMHGISTNPIVKAAKRIVGGFLEFFGIKTGFTVFRTIDHAVGLHLSCEDGYFEMAKRFCTDGTASPGPQSCYKINDQALIDNANQYSSGAICGTGAEEMSLYAVLNWLTSYYNVSSPNPELNDGVVPLASCIKVQPRRYLKEKDNDFWQAPFNHNDITGANAKPDILTWLKNRK